MKSFFALALIAATAFAAEEAAAETTEAAAEEAGPKITKVDWSANFDDAINVSSAAGEFWTVAGEEGKHTFYISATYATSADKKFPLNNWFFNSIAFQLPAPAAPADGAARLL